MKKILSIFIALALVLSLFTGVSTNTAKAATASISTVSPITNGAITPNVVVTLTGDVFSAATTSENLTNWTFDYGTTGLTAAVITRTSGTVATMDFTGTAAAGTVTIQAMTLALATTTDSNILSIVVPALFVPTQLTITAPALTLTKVYDTTTTAAVTAGALLGVVSPDVVTVSATATYATAAVGTDKTITVVYVLGGANAEKYIKPVDYVVTTGVITTAPTGLPLGLVALTASQVSGTTNVLLNWTTSVADATMFQIFRNGVSLGYIAASTMTYTDATTVVNQLYNYYILPINAVGNGTPSSTKAVAITAVVATTPPTTLGTLGITTTGTFVGGVDGTGALGVNGVGTVISGSGTSYVINVTTAAVGTFDPTLTVQALRQTGATSTNNSSWASTGIKTITLDTPTTTIAITPGMQIAIDGSGTNGIGTVLGVSANTLVVNMTTAAVGILGPNVYQVSTVHSVDPNWKTLGNQTITFTSAPTLIAGDKLFVSMVQAVPATAATAFVMVTGTPVVGDIVTLTWQDTTGVSHSVTYTTIAGDTSNKVALALSQLITALDVTTGKVNVSNTPITGSVLQLTQDVGGVVGNGKSVTGTVTTTAAATFIVHTLGGLLSPAYVEQGKTLQLVALATTGAIVPVTYTMTPASSVLTLDGSTTTGTTGLVLGLNTGVQVITATAATGATGTFVVVVIPPQVITSLTVGLIPSVLGTTTTKQFSAIAASAAYPSLDYTTNAGWTDTLSVASIAAKTGLLTYSTDETGNVYASAGGITAAGNVKITTGVVTLIPVVSPVAKVIVLSIGSDLVTVDGTPTSVDAAPEITNGRTFVPIRFIAETFGSTVTWLPETKRVNIVLGATTIGLQIGNTTTVINGKIILLEAAPYIKNSRTMVPLRVISEAFGGNVAWDPINRLITITYVLPIA